MGKNTKKNGKKDLDYGGIRMTDELYELYKSDPDFKHYVDAWCQKHDLSIFEAFRMHILQEYSKWLKENK